MKYNLGNICRFRKEKIDVASLKCSNYISTENMLPNKGGIVEASSLPTTSQVQAYKYGDVLVSNIRPYFKKIWKAEFDGGCSNDVLVFESNSGVDEDFLYYVLADDAFFAYATATSKGTKMPRGDKTAIMQYDIPKIGLLQQRKIASVLKSLDNKICLNNMINNNLLQLAILIFNRLIEGKDKNGCIGDYCTLKSGFAFKSFWWQKTGIPVVKIGSINQDNLDLNSCSYVSEDKITLAKDFIVTGGDLLIAMTGATIGKFTMVPLTDELILVNQRVGKFFLGCNPIERLPFIYCQLKQEEIYREVINRGQGSAQPNISASDIMSIPCVIPSCDDINIFNTTVKPMFEAIIAHQKENQRWASLRDILLPKLMFGELDISKVAL